MVSEEGERFVPKARYPRVPAPFSFWAKLKGEVPVQEGEEPWYLALSLPQGYASRRWIEERFRDLKGAGLEGRPWLHRLVAHPERQSLFTLGRLPLAQPPPGLKGHILRLFHRVLAELAGGRKGGRK